MRRCPQGPLRADCSIRTKPCPVACASCVIAHKIIGIAFCYAFRVGRFQPLPRCLINQ
ncbi:protein of unknown function [Cupriavidus taiwanensis]|nr:protein of unknown function [Cupriavidus taiwanensis]